MASTLCLGPDHQPQSQGSPRIYRERKARLDDDSFFNLFGAGDCLGAKAERSRARRALPVNTLTGAIIGSRPAHQVEQTFRPTQSPPRGKHSQARPGHLTETECFRSETSRWGPLSSLVKCLPRTWLALILEKNEILANLVLEFGKVHWSPPVLGIDLNEKPVLRFNTTIESISFCCVYFIIK